MQHRHSLQHAFLTYNPARGVDMTHPNSRICLKNVLFETIASITKSFLQQGYTIVSKSVSKSTSQYLTNAMSFDTILVYATNPLH
jgi:hypothetical protein